MKMSTLLSREEVVLLIERAYNRRMFVAVDIKDYVTNLPEEKAFAASRLLPKEVLSKLTTYMGTGNDSAWNRLFADKILDYHASISKDGPLVEVAKVKLADEQFLISHSSGLLTAMGVEGY